jgi:hypothetical protein
MNKQKSRTDLESMALFVILGIMTLMFFFGIQVLLESRPGATPELQQPATLGIPNSPNPKPNP